MNNRLGLGLALVAALALGGYVAHSAGVLDSYFPDPAIRICDDAVRTAIRSPATYRRAEAFIYQAGVNIAFDAENGFGGNVRSYAVCSFAIRPSSNGGFVLASITIDAERLTDSALNAAAMRQEPLDPGRTSLSR